MFAQIHVAAFAPCSHKLFSSFGKLLQKAPGGAAKTLRGTLSVVLASFYKSLRPSKARSLGRASQRAKHPLTAFLF